MLKLLRYEIKESSKYFIYTIVGNVLASLILAFTLGSINKAAQANKFVNNTIAGIMFLAAFTLFIAAYVGFIFMMITSYRKDLYSDSAYLKFSLPVSGWTFLNAKMLLLMFWSFIMATVTIVVNIVVYLIIFPEIITEILNNLNMNYVPSLIIYGLLIVLSFIQGIILLYTCITFVKAYFKNSKKGYIWFLFYVGFNIFWSIINTLLEKLAPYYLTLGDKVGIEKIPYYNTLDYLYGATSSVYPGAMNYNIATLVIYFVVCIGMYVFTAYMLEKKVDI
ncbi:hypothetical protein [Miniphocaeibacter massiliensis]|uniref:hypothetical protein n=1 Tax=Miniphocaeibacter massiliensis TaxID=2041841 RepID=UPI000C1C76E0|nr:hypothetical protein [Miniphocaeibacter massiliensis]